MFVVYSFFGFIKYRNRNDFGGKIVWCIDGEFSGSVVYGIKWGWFRWSIYRYWNGFDYRIWMDKINK